ncbi:MAG: LytTR family DNA-binding domain-containing protein [Bacteroidota bacterium]
MIKAIVIDDEKAARSALNHLLKLYCPKVKIIADASSIKEGKRQIEQLLPNLVFLDIAIGANSGFDLLEALPSIDFQLIFTTAHEEYAAKAFQLNAIHYLLKPIEPTDLIAAIHRIEEHLRRQQLEQQIEYFTQLGKEKEQKSIIVSSAENIRILEATEIVFLKGSGNYTTFHLQSGEAVVASKNLGHYKLILDQEQFFSPHQSYVINLTYIKSIKTKEEHRIILKDDTHVPISRKHKDHLMQLLLERGTK